MTGACPAGGSPGADPGTGRYFGLYPAIVTDIIDGDRLSRIEVKFPWLGVATAMRPGQGDVAVPLRGRRPGIRRPPRGRHRGGCRLRGGGPAPPYIVGSGVERPGDDAVTPTRPNNKRLIKSRAGSLLEFDDTSGPPR